MSDWLMRVIKAEAARLIELAAEDDDLRNDLRALATSILAATEDVHVETEASLQPDTLPLRELTLGRSSPAKHEIRPAHTTAPHPTQAGDDLATLEDRCRRKGEAARWAVERLRRLHEGNGFAVENAPSDPEMIAWADRLTDGFYWMSRSESVEAGDLTLLDHVAGCFETVAESLALVRGMPEGHAGSPRNLERSLPLVTEAQSGLRAAIQRLGAPADSDQLDVFEWLKATAARNHIFIKRFMRADESADPAGWSELLARVESAAPRGKLGRLTETQVQRIQEQVNRLRENGVNDDDALAIMTAVDEIIETGIPPSNRELRDLVLPVIDDFPEHEVVPKGFRLFLKSLDHFLATRPAPVPSRPGQEASAAVQESRRLLSGKSVVLIGGDRRREAQESLRRAFGLSALIWIETREHQAVDAFEPMIARPDVAVVLLAIRWSSHAFGDVRQICERHGKPLVRLPGGYNPNQVAAQVIAQSRLQLSSVAGLPGPHAHPQAQSGSGP